MTDIAVNEKQSMVSSSETAEGMMGKVSNLLYPFIWTDCFVRFGSKANMSAIDGINKSDIPVMIIHGKKDTMIGYDR